MRLFWLSLRGCAVCSFLSVCSAFSSHRKELAKKQLLQLKKLRNSLPLKW